MRDHFDLTLLHESGTGLGARSLPRPKEETPQTYDGGFSSSLPVRS